MSSKNKILTSSQNIHRSASLLRISVLTQTTRPEGTSSKINIPNIPQVQVPNAICCRTSTFQYHHKQQPTHRMYSQQLSNQGQVMPRLIKRLRKLLIVLEANSYKKSLHLTLHLRRLARLRLRDSRMMVTTRQISPSPIQSK